MELPLTVRGASVSGVGAILELHFGHINFEMSGKY